MAHHPLRAWKSRFDAAMAMDDTPYIDLLDLVEDANQIISDLLQGGMECIDQDSRTIIDQNPDCQARQGIEQEQYLPTEAVDP